EHKSVSGFFGFSSGGRKRYRRIDRVTALHSDLCHLLFPVNPSPTKETAAGSAGTRRHVEGAQGRRQSCHHRGNLRNERCSPREGRYGSVENCAVGVCRG